jgi:hypothetical protein
MILETWETEDRSNTALQFQVSLARREPDPPENHQNPTLPSDHTEGLHVWGKLRGWQSHRACASASVEQVLRLSVATRVSKGSQSS